MYIDSDSVTFKDITVYHTRDLWGGGNMFGQEFLEVVKRKLGKVEHICEFGSGPGYIGFSLLAHGLCKRLTLIDINPKAIELCNKTIKENHLEDRVTVYVSDCFDNVPLSEKWDLVVSNPPHYEAPKDEADFDIKRYDPEWRVHKKFYSGVGKHLKPNGSVMFQEKKEGSTIESFRAMILENDLKIIDVFEARHSLVDCIKCIAGGKGPLWCLNKFLKYRFYFVWTKPNASTSN